MENEKEPKPGEIVDGGLVLERIETGEGVALRVGHLDHGKNAYIAAMIAVEIAQGRTVALVSGSGCVIFGPGDESVEVRDPWRDDILPRVVEDLQKRVYTSRPDSYDIDYGTGNRADRRGKKEHTWTPLHKKR